MSLKIDFEDRVQATAETCQEILRKGSCIPGAGVVSAVALLVVSVVTIIFVFVYAIWGEGWREGERLIYEAGFGVSLALGAMATAGLGLLVIQGMYQLCRDEDEPSWFFEA